MKTEITNDAILKKEIEELEAKKKSARGIGGFLQKISLNKEINERMKALRLPVAKAKAIIAEHELREARAKKEIAEIKRKSIISIDDLMGKNPSSGVKF